MDLAFIVLLILGHFVTVNANETQNMTITVKITFEGKQPGQLAEGSCLVVSAEHGGIADAPAKIFDKLIRRNPNLESQSSMTAKLEFPKPEMVHEIAISATINSGWCSADNKEEWIRKGDYFTDTMFSVYMDNGDSYDKDITVHLVPYS